MGDGRVSAAAVGLSPARTEGRRTPGGLFIPEVRTGFPGFPALFPSIVMNCHSDSFST